MEKAISQIDTAVKLFMNDKDYCSSITLAGAAEDILKDFIERDGNKATYANMKFNLSLESGLTEKEVNDKYTNKLRNWLKHSSGIEDDYIVADEEIEAIQHIIRCIGNYVMLKGEIKQNYLDFLNFIKKNNKELFNGRYRLKEFLDDNINKQYE